MDTFFGGGGGWYFSPLPFAMTCVGFFLCVTSRNVDPRKEMFECVFFLSLTLGLGFVLFWEKHSSPPPAAPPSSPAAKQQPLGGVIKIY